MHKKHKRPERRIKFMRELAQIKVEIAYYKEAERYACPCCELVLVQEELEKLEHRLFEHLFHHRF